MTGDICGMDTSAHVRIARIRETTVIVLASGGHCFAFSRLVTA